MARKITGKTWVGSLDSGTQPYGLRGYPRASARRCFRYARVNMSMSPSGSATGRRSSLAVQCPDDSVKLID